MFKLYLDDERVEPEGWFRVTTAENCIFILENHPYEIEELSLDHDLDDHVCTRNGYCEPSPLTGYEVAKWLEEKAFNNEWSFVPKILKCHSDNPAGRKRIIQAFESISKMREKYESTIFVESCKIK